MTAGPDGLVIRAGSLLRPEAGPGPGWVLVRDRLIAGVGYGPTPAGIPVLDVGDDAVITPGFVDMHVHGGGGHTMTSTDPVEIEAAASFHLREGTTASVVSLITAPIPALQAQLDTVAGLTRPARPGHGHILGSHLEGPFLSPHRRGVHPTDHLLAPDPAHIRILLDAARGSLRMLTLAAELPGVLGPDGAVQTLVVAGVTVAVGHTDASYETATAALEEGATVGTHLFNGMRPMGHRDPGPAAAVLNHAGTVVELITDGIHVDPAVARIAVRAAGTDRLALITDAVAATGAPDGYYRLGETTIRQHGGKIMLADGTSLGGSNLTLAAALKGAVDTLGLSLAEAVNAATAVPARALGCQDRVGRLEAGRSADLVVLDNGQNVVAIMAAGAWIRYPPDASNRNALTGAGTAPNHPAASPS